jgi:hypothetical protein
MNTEDSSFRLADQTWSKSDMHDWEKIRAFAMSNTGTWLRANIHQPAANTASSPNSMITKKPKRQSSLIR